MSKQNSQSGFTLIELSIVLIIIGLIVGGVLTGQDLIKAAKSRALVAQIQNYDTAINTFQLKYNGVPGDLKTAASFLNSAATNGDGNSRIESATLTVGVSGVFDSEIGSVWNHLGLAEMTDKAYLVAGAALLDTMAPTAKTGTGSLAILYIPATATSKAGHYIAIGSGDGSAAGTGGSIDGATGFFGVAASTDGLTPTQAFGVDAKLDDENSDTGTVQIVTNSAATNIATPATTECIAAAGIYNLILDEAQCNLVIKMSAI